MGKSSISMAMVGVVSFFPFLPEYFIKDSPTTLVDSQPLKTWTAETMVPSLQETSCYTRYNDVLMGYMMVIQWDLMEV